MFSNDEIADFLDDAADYMENHGSCRGVMQDENGRVCMLGAMDMVLTRMAAPFRYEFDNEAEIVPIKNVLIHFARQLRS